MLLTLTLNFLPACTKNSATGPTFGPFYKKANKAKKLTICIGNSAPFRTFLLKNLEKFTTDFLENKNYLLAPFELPGRKSARCSPVLQETIWEGKVHCRECSCRHCYKVLRKTLRLSQDQIKIMNNFIMGIKRCQDLVYIFVIYQKDSKSASNSAFFTAILNIFQNF